jgi:hypothetical protein
MTWIFSEQHMFELHVDGKTLFSQGGNGVHTGSSMRIQTGQPYGSSIQIGVGSDSRSVS